MRPSWSPMLTLMTVAALAPLYVAAAADAADAGLAILPANATHLGWGPTLVIAAAGDYGQSSLRQFQLWLANGYERAPALMLGLAVLLAVPPLALAGLVIGRTKRQNPDVTVMLPKKARQQARAVQRTLQTDISPWPTEAWVEADGIPGGRRVIGRTLLRIGREDDNDIRFAVKTVHRYHAVIRRTTDGVVMITDVSGKDGNGVLVNGARVAEARLAKGDVISLGEVKMRFDARPV